MIDFSDPNSDSERWLKAQTRDAVIAFTARAALRVLPALNLPRKPTGDRLGWRGGVLSVFRALSAVWAFAAYPGCREQLREAASLSFTGMGHEGLHPVVRAAGLAAAAATPVSGDIAYLASQAVDAVIEGAALVSDEALEITLQALNIDGELMEQRTSPVVMATAQLWPRRVPDWVNDEWHLMQQTLLQVDEYWEVWTSWYEDRLKGREALQELEISRATVPEKIWKIGPRSVNNRIRGILADNGIKTRRINEYLPNASDQPLSLDEMRVVAARAALRAIPFLAKDFDPQGRSALDVFRIACCAWAIVRFSDLEKTQADLAVATRRSASSGGVARSVALVVAPTFAKLISDEVSGDLTLGLGRLKEKSHELAGSVGSATFDLALRDDVNDVRGIDPRQVLGLPLWPGNSPPDWANQLWLALRKELIRIGANWEVWIKWYEDRLTGTLRSDAHELTYISVPEEFWVERPTKVNTWILDQLGDLQGNNKEGEDLVALGQRPSAYQFALRANLIEAVPQHAIASDQSTATDILAELKVKASDLSDRLKGSNSNPRVVETLRRLLDSLGDDLEHLKPGILLMRVRSLQADALAFDAAEGRELFTNAIAMIRDVISSADDLMATFPAIRAIQAAALALELQRSDVERVQKHLAEIRDLAGRSSIVAQSARDALEAAVPDVEEASRVVKSAENDISRAAAIELRAQVVSLQVLDYRNFSSAVIRPLVTAGKGLRWLGTEATDVAARSFKEAKDAIPRGVGAGVEGAVGGVIKGGVATLVGSIFGPLVGLAVLIASFKPLAQKAKEVTDEIGTAHTDTPPIESDTTHLEA